MQTAIDLVRALLGNLPQSSSNPSSSIPSQTLGSSSLEVDRFQGVGEGNILELLQHNEQRTKSFNILKDCFGLSQQWADENIPSTEDLRSIVSQF